jgi:hypothetical protein
LDGVQGGFTQKSDGIGLGMRIFVLLCDERIHNQNPCNVLAALQVFGQ